MVENGCARVNSSFEVSLWNLNFHFTVRYFRECIKVIPYMVVVLEKYDV